MWKRLVAIFVKEVQQLKRDRLTFAMMFGVPIMQLLLFCYPINTDPHNLPTAVISADPNTITRTIQSPLSSTAYMPSTRPPPAYPVPTSLLQHCRPHFCLHN